MRVVRQFEDEVGSLYDDDDFWRYQARSLAVFVAPRRLITFRLPNRLLSQVEVSDRFHLRPLLRALTFPQFARSAAGDVHDVADEIARRAWLSGARVLAVREREIPARSPIAAILRYPV